MSPTTNSPTLDVLAPALLDAARAFYRFGWLMGGSGNMSTRLADDQLVVTPTGTAKNRLEPDDLVTLGVAINADTPEEASEDLDLHRLIYDRVDDARTIFHVHHLEATLCSNRDQKQGFTHLHDVQMLRAITGTARGEELRVNLPIADAATVDAFEALLDDPTAPCLNVLDHGLYVWGRTIDEARSRLEALAYLYEYSWQRPMSPKRSSSISGFDPR